MYPFLTLVNMGIKDILIIISSDGGSIINLLQDGIEFGVNITYAYQKDPLGIAHAIGKAEDFAQGDDIVVVLGDSIFTKDIEIKAPPHLYLSHSDCPKDFGAVCFYGENIMKIEERCENPKSKFVTTGIYIYPNNVFKVIKKLKVSKRNKLEISDINNHYLPKMAYTILDDGVWFDTNDPEQVYNAIFKARLNHLEIKAISQR